MQEKIKFSLKKLQKIIKMVIDFSISGKRSKQFQALMVRWNIKQEVIPPGQPFNNGHIKSFHSILRKECFNREIFIDIMEARDKIKGWIEDYNNKRLHSALDYWMPMKIWEEKSLGKIILLLMVSSLGGHYNSTYHKF